MEVLKIFQYKTSQVFFKITKSFYKKTEFHYQIIFLLIRIFSRNIIAECAELCTSRGPRKKIRGHQEDLF